MEKELWQVDEAKQRGGSNGQGGKEAEVLQQVGVGEEETAEGADGGDAAEEQGLRLFAQQLLAVLDVVAVGEHVEHVAQSHAEHHAADAEGKQGELSAQEVHHRHGEERAKGNGQQQQRQRVPTAEAHHDKDEHQHQGTSDGRGEVVLDDGGVIVAAGGRTVVADVDVGRDGGKAVYQLVHAGKECRALAGVRSGELWGDERYADGRVTDEEMTVDGRVAAASGIKQRGHLVGEDVAKAQRVALDEFREHAAELAL